MDAAGLLPLALLPLGLLFDLTASALVGPSHTDPDFIKGIVDAHNQYRSAVTPKASDMLRMTWDPALALTAKGWSQQCIFDHNPDLQKPGKAHPTFNPVGENIWLGGPSTTVSPTKPWYDEVKDYTYATHTCSGVCGHYTQVVWASSYKVGCAATVCETIKKSTMKNMMILVCNYAPAGNYPQRPYSEGEACSKCPAGDKCENNMCANSERDKIKDPGNWKPSFGSAGVASSFIQLHSYSVLFCLTCIYLYLLV
ncbi:GLIPR1-like protein 1 [Ambystoma mexicanum]|uniref:GLIPR1-like protein 1 n=1 Tax=Ambystoma mexicanum TaxID=8296 RepID=UPI0037E8D6BA